MEVETNVRAKNGFVKDQLNLSLKEYFATRKQSLLRVKPILT